MVKHNELLAFSSQNIIPRRKMFKEGPAVGIAFALLDITSDNETKSTPTNGVLLGGMP